MSLRLPMGVGTNTKCAFVVIFFAFFPCLDELMVGWPRSPCSSYFCDNHLHGIAAFHLISDLFATDFYWAACWVSEPAVCPAVCWVGLSVSGQVVKVVG